MTELDQILNPKAITERSKATLRMREFMALDIDKYIALKESHDILIIALDSTIKVLKDERLINSLPDHEMVITEAKKL